MTLSKELKDANEELYQQWLEQNKEYLLRFIKENLSIMTECNSLGGNEYQHTIHLCTEDEGSFSNDNIYVQE